MASKKRDARDIFNAAKGRSPKARKRYVRRACQGNQKLSREVFELLAAYDQAASFLEVPAFNSPLAQPAAQGHDGASLQESAAFKLQSPEANPATVNLPYGEQPGVVIGKYKLVKELGRGGFGAVYKAEQNEPIKRFVALKIIRPDIGINREMIARFEAERQALASLDHPNIAKILDAGTTDAREPYFVMELLEGQHITQFCDQKKYSLDKRLKLFVVVCHAIQYAHFKGIVHRDLKPSNILVAEVDGQVVLKIIDFGIAKALKQPLTDKPWNTRLDQVLGTFKYMSPEQAQGSQGVDTRSDVYSLGVLLYELLTGQTPFENELERAVYFKAVQVICQAQPPKPSTKLLSCQDLLPSISAQRDTEPARLKRLLRNDLDLIALKALDKRPNDRYQSPLDFANDINNYLTDQPITAQERSYWYHLRKFTKRHWVGVSMAAFAILCLLTTTIVSAGYARWAISSRDEAIESRNDAIAARKESTRSAALAKLENIRLLDRSAGWSRECQELHREAIEASPQVEDKDIASVVLQGTDMRLVKQWHGFDCNSVRFMPDSNGFIAVGLPGADGHSPVQICSNFEHPLALSQKSLLGPIRIVNGQPMGVRVLPDKKTVALASLVSEFQGAECPIPEDLPSNLAGITLDESGQYIACAFQPPQPRQEGVIVVWNARQGKVVLREKMQELSALAISPQNGLLVSGTKTGQLTAFDLKTGKRIAEFQSGRFAVHAVAFAPRLKRPLPVTAEDAIPNWTLAVGTAGGMVCLWDLDDPPVLRAKFSGGNFDVYSLDFHPDGTLLATAGRNHVRVWDMVSGKPLLRLEASKLGGNDRNFELDVSFSPDGQCLAVASMSGFGYPGGIDVWEFDAHRPILPLRGLTGQIEKIVYSKDGRTVAALSHDWRVGVWDVATGHLIHEWDVPPGEWADNADIVFDPQGNLLVYAAFQDAMILDLKRGTVKSAWKLPPALTNRLSFLNEKTLYLLRVEAPDVTLQGAASIQHGPRITRIRNLFAEYPLAPLAELSIHDRGANYATVADNGNVFVIDGYRSSPQEPRSVIAIEAATGNQLWSHSSQQTGGGRIVNADGTGSQVAAMIEVTGTAQIFDVRTGELLIGLDRFPDLGFSKAAQLWATAIPGDKGLILNRNEQAAPWLTLGMDDRVTAGSLFTSGSTELMVWGNAAGEVFLARLPLLQERLSSLSLP